MMPHHSPSAAQVWFRRSMAFTVALGALVVLFVAARPGYAGFFVASTLAFVHFLYLQTSNFLLALFDWVPAFPESHPRYLKYSTLFINFFVFDTDWTSKWPAGRKQASIERTLLKRACTPADIAAAIVFLCADTAMVTAQTLVVDGGYSL